MAKVVNLNRARKRLAKLVDKRKSDHNAIRHGLPKHERAQLEMEKRLIDRRFAGNRLSDEAPANEACERQDAKILAWPSSKAASKIAAISPDESAQASKDASTAPSTDLPHDTTSRDDPTKRR